MSDARRQSFYLRWREGCFPFYEVFFIKGNLPRAEKAFWLRYTLSASGPQRVLSQLWGIVFDARRPENNFAVRQDFPQAPVWQPTGRLVIGASELTLENASGRIEDPERNHRLEWNIDFSSPVGPLWHFPHGAMYRFKLPKTKLAAPWWHGKLSGRLQIDGELFEFTGAPGQLEHLWGSEHGLRWAWGHCNCFEEDVEAVWEGLDAQIRLGPLASPHLKVFFLRAFGKSYRFNSLRRWFLNRSRWQPGGWFWEFEAAAAGARLTGRARIDSAQVVVVTYTDPGGEKLWCHNTKLARLELELFEGGRRVGELHSKNSAAVEFVDRRIYPGVRLML